MQQAETIETSDICEQTGEEAEALYRSGKMHCAEAVLASLMRRFRPELPEEVVRTASGFGGGSGSGCICGAITGATIAMGLVQGEKRKEVMRLTAELHSWFKEGYGSTCCRVLKGHRSGICAEITGSVAAKTAGLLSAV